MCCEHCVHKIIHVKIRISINENRENKNSDQQKAMSSMLLYLDKCQQIACDFQAAKVKFHR